IGQFHLARQAAEATGPGLADTFQFGPHPPPALRYEADGDLLFSHCSFPCVFALAFLLYAYRSWRRMIMSETATLSSKFQISIPKAIRTAQHWEAGLTFAFIPKGTGVLLVPVPKREALKGLARGASTTDYRDRADRF